VNQEDSEQNEVDGNGMKKGADCNVCPIITS